ncbi:Kiwa anti-phage protein KwaB-like domain-containing protein [Mesorhizobium sp. NZP2298]|uniref:Kiwa anti-phage protein KwaB-like domain-containing protein n=1 Tax=Mesorhizobium sp. NZP2298 TaxID=2483403 RepID=UPI0015571267|nr:Kiwa anti-phage protein KwaB-like domain-containing protein [Mesorhizobium sp. NZP2298]QKC97167.1 DUF4868 domain-containing protein [Mesorhizobium sp. NZP2298]
MPIPQALANFNIADAAVSVWLFRKSGLSDAPVFTGRWVPTDDALRGALRESINQARAEIQEAEPYGLLATIEDGQALTIGTDETHAGLIVDAAAAELPQKRAQSVGHMQNTDFYVIKLIHQNQVLHAVTKTNSSWKSRQTHNLLTVYFTGDQLGLETDPTFSLSRGVDFFIVGMDIVILDKSDFESILNYKQAHASEFADLQAEAAFAGLFVDLEPLVAFVGSNKLHLRRACAIRQKGYYLSQQFMQRLRQNHAQAGLNLTFDGNGRLIATEAQCPDIIRAFLDHRLLSVFSESYYDVQNATAIP